MPAAAVIPAPIAYIKAAAVKKLVVGSRAPAGGSLHGFLLPATALQAGSPRVLLVECLGRPEALL